MLLACPATCLEVCGKPAPTRRALGFEMASALAGGRPSAGRECAAQGAVRRAGDRAGGLPSGRDPLEDTEPQQRGKGTSGGRRAEGADGGG